MFNIEELMSEMTLREKIGQTVILNNQYIYDEEKTKENLERSCFGGFFVGKEIIGGVANTGDDIVDAIKRVNKYSKIPPIICADTEYGCGYLFEDGKYSAFPHQMTLGATRDTSLAYEYGKYTAIPAREIGINLSLGPVCDINMNFMNPIVNTRAIGDDAELVGDMLVSMIRGMSDYGMGATAKHFPGDGVDYRDQHFVLTSNTLSVEEWRRTFGEVYKRLIDNGLLCVMAGHISFPAYQKERIYDVAPPATLSKELICDLLKGELGFKYAVMSDALCMGGFRSTYPERIQSEIECFKAGVDLMLWPLEEYPDALEKAIVSGEIPMSRLDDAVRRILLLKQELGLLDNREYNSDTMDGVMTLDGRVCESGITLVRDRAGLLPAKDVKNVAIIAVTTYDDEVEGLSVVVDEFAKNGIKAEVYRNEFKGDRSSIDLFLYYTFCYPHKPRGILQVLPYWSSAEVPREKAAVVALGSPYLINSNFVHVNAAIALYSDTEQSKRSSVRAILGQIEFKGTLPVKLP